MILFINTFSNTILHQHQISLCFTSLSLSFSAAFIVWYTSDIQFAHDFLIWVYNCYS